MQFTRLSSSLSLSELDKIRIEEIEENEDDFKRTHSNKKQNGLEI